MKLSAYKQIKKTKKEHECFWCHKKIDPGSSVYYEFVYSGYFKKANFSCYYHDECWKEISKDIKYDLLDINYLIQCHMLNIKELYCIFELNNISRKDLDIDLKNEKRKINLFEKDKQKFWKIKGEKDETKN